KMKYAFLIALWLPWSFHTTAASALRVIAGGHGPNLLADGGFETVQGGETSPWRPGPQGCAFAEGEGRQGSRALVGETSEGQGWFGASQSLVLNRTVAIPLVVRGWSKASAVSGAADSNYSLYVDLTYVDGTPLWGQSASFRPGTHDWQER